MYYSVEQGEGVAGNAYSLSATTTALSNCMGILFLDEGSTRAGLYHYGGKSLGDVRVQQTITAMMRFIAPTLIQLTPALSDPMNPSGTGTDPSDVAKVEEFIKNEGYGAKFEKMPPRIRANYFLSGHALKHQRNL